MEKVSRKKMQGGMKGKRKLKAFKDEGKSGGPRHLRNHRRQGRGNLQKEGGQTTLQGKFLAFEAGISL